MGGTDQDHNLRPLFLTLPDWLTSVYLEAISSHRKSGCRRQKGDARPIGPKVAAACRQLDPQVPVPPGLSDRVSMAIRG